MRRYTRPFLLVSVTVVALVSGATVVAAQQRTAVTTAAGTQGCSSEPPLVDGVRTFVVADFTAALAAIQANCPLEKEVHFEFPKGDRTQAPMQWSYLRPGQTIRFMTQGYGGYRTDGPCPAQADMAHFLGGWAVEPMFAFYAGGATPFDLNMEFHCLKMSRNMQAFVSIGPRVGEGEHDPIVRGVKFNGMVFYRLGNAGAPDPTREYGRGAIVAKNTGGLVVKNSIFASLVNVDPGGRPSWPGSVHALYLMRASGTVMEHNVIQSVSGDPFRVSNNADSNRFAYNTVTNSGSYALASDWYDTSKSTHGPSRGNVVRNNKFGYLYGRSVRPQMTYCYDIQAHCGSSRINDYDNVAL